MKIKWSNSSPDKPAIRGATGGRFAAGSADAGSAHGFVILGFLLMLVGIGVILLCGFLIPSGETRALRSAVASTLNQTPHKVVHLNVGWVTTTALKTGARWFDMPEEARVALGSVKGVEVGVYELPESVSGKPGRVLSTADRKMSRLGWERVVGVVDGRQVVAVYVPARKLSASRVEACIMVLEGRQLVVGTGKGDLEELMELGWKRLRQEVGLKRRAD